ncbi:thioredoxin family protein [Mangrovimonas cancribranchiae]|uniref:Thioredoxin fold domain-containing protein n=1 Tax=Mangrovimonas cancribranchiae TaxID=3080055 RepID=A0AAU6P7E7_9FLAO
MRTHITILIVSLLFVGNLWAQEINWVSLEEAVELQKKNPKKIILDAYTKWCGPCKMLDRNTFSNKDVAAYINEHYYAVKFNAEGNEEITFKDNTFTNPNYDPAKANRRNSPHQLSRYFSIRSYPTLVFLDENANLLAPIIGYKTPQQLELYLKLFKDNKHTDMNTQEKFNAYYKAFKPEFSN